jgi:hypothetical protein
VLPRAGRAAGLADVVGAVTSTAGKTSLSLDAVWAWAPLLPGTRHSDNVPISRNRAPISFHPHSLPVTLVPCRLVANDLRASIGPRTIQNVPDESGKIPGSVTRVPRDHGLHSYAIISGSNRERATQRQNALAHSREPKTKLVIRPQSAAIVADPDQSATASG